MGTPEPDQYLTGSLVNSLPTCSFSPRPYARKITRILVSNSAQSTANVYRSSLTSFPVASTPIGQNNTLLDVIKIPAGQPFFVQWSAVGTNVRDATARVTIEKDDNPLDVDQNGGWSVVPIFSLTLPSVAGVNDPRLVLGPDLPAILVSFYSPNTVVASEIAYANATDFHYTAWVHIASTGETIQATGFVKGNAVWETILQYFDPNSGAPISITIGDAFGVNPFTDYTLTVDAVTFFEGNVTFDGGIGVVAEFTSGSTLQIDSGANATRNGIHIPYAQHGNTNFNFTAQTSQTLAETFSPAFPVGVTPKVFTNINNGSGAVQGWFSRAFNITNTGFTLWVTGPSATWTNVNVQWMAFDD